MSRESKSLGSLSLDEKIGQFFCIGLPGPTIDDETKRLLDDVSPGGICLFARNIRDLPQVRALTDELRANMPIEPLISIDQEGGLVDRLRRVLTPMPAASKLRSPEDAARLGSLIGEALRILGFNMDFAPVVDVIDDGRRSYRNGLSTRAFGTSRDDVVEFSRAFLAALQQNGIKGCLKHFPGLGASQVDSHDDLPMVEITMEDLQGLDIFPYMKLLNEPGVEAVMCGHAAFPSIDIQEFLDDGRPIPASLSYNFISVVLRHQLGFDGVAITDDLEMGAILRHFGIGEGCCRAIQAGADVLAICGDPENIRTGKHAVMAAVDRGEISEERISRSLGRISTLKSRFAAPAAFDEIRLSEITREILEFSASLDG